MNDIVSFPKGRRPVPFETFTPGAWAGLDPPPYDWIVEGCFLRGTVAMLSGDGGLGKSLLMQQLCTAAAVGKPWLGLNTKSSRVFGLFCEDARDELHRRQEAINRHYDCDYADAGERAVYVSRAGEDNILALPERRNDKLIPTQLYTQICEAVLDFGAQIIVIDTVADVFAGDEIRRAQVRQFVTLLRRLAVKAQGCVILTAHPSLAGMSSGTGLSGSTAWNNSVRSRLYLSRRHQDSDDEPAEEARNERWLKTMKNNAGPFGAKIPLAWRDGVFQRTDQQAAPGPPLLDRIDLQSKLVDTLRALVRDGAFVGADKSSPQSLANRARKLPQVRPYSFAAVAAAVDELLADGRVVRVELGPPSKRRVYLRPPDALYPGESPA
jgi:RecA-family ATPase